MRDALAWTQRDLAERARVSQAWVSLLERGLAPAASLARVERVANALGGRLVVGLDAPFLADRARQRDPAHSRMSAYVAGRLRRAGWSVEGELEVGGDRSRGWIDLLAFHSRTRVLLVVELKTEIHDLGGIVRALAWYEREAWAAARSRGWQPRRVLSCLLLLATEATDHRALANRAILDIEFPLRARHLAGIDGGLDVIEGSRSGRAVGMVDPRSRRVRWVRPLVLDGRRTPAPYADYAAFVRGERRGGRLPARR